MPLWKSGIKKRKKIWVKRKRYAGISREAVDGCYETWEMLWMQKVRREQITYENERWPRFSPYPLTCVPESCAGHRQNNAHNHVSRGSYIDSLTKSGERSRKEGKWKKRKLRNSSSSAADLWCIAAGRNRQTWVTLLSVRRIRIHWTLSFQVDVSPMFRFTSFTKEGCSFVASFFTTHYTKHYWCIELLTNFFFDDALVDK